MAPAPATQLNCPVCKKDCELPANVESLPTNQHAMCIIQLMNKAKDERNSQKWVNFLYILVHKLRLP